MQDYAFPKLNSIKLDSHTNPPIASHCVAEANIYIFENNQKYFSKCTSLMLIMSRLKCTVSMYNMNPSDGLIETVI